MKTLNLVYPERSEVKYIISNFPDEQKQVKIIEGLKSHPPYEGAHIREYIQEAVQIQARLNNWEDLHTICCAVASLRDEKVGSIHLYVPYFLGARSDRKFELGSNNYLKNVICPVVNSLGFKSVITVDPHSDVLEACLDNFEKLDNKTIVEYFISDTNAELDNFILVSPDAGAEKKIQKVAENINYTGDIIVCSKHRDEKGKLTKTHVPLNTNYSDKNFVIIDDICDGGRTFINIAKEIKNNFPTNKIYLIVTHGIFSKGFGELQQYFEAIYTSNSYKDFLPDCAPFIKQRNIYSV